MNNLSQCNRTTRPNLLSPMAPMKICMQYQTIHAPFRVEKPVHNSQLGLSFQLEWRKVPYFLHELKRKNVSVFKARLHHCWTSLYLNSEESNVSAAIYQPYLEEVLKGSVAIDDTPMYQSGLHPGTNITVYNTPTLPYTVINFSCPDRVGLFCEMLEFLAPYNIEVAHGYCNSVNSIATNLFFITDPHGDRLTPKNIEFIRNLFEYDLKKRITAMNDLY